MKITDLVKSNDEFNLYGRVGIVSNFRASRHPCRACRDGHMIEIVLVHVDFGEDGARWINKKYLTLSE